MNGKLPKVSPFLFGLAALLCLSFFALAKDAPEDSGSFTDDGSGTGEGFNDTNLSNDGASLTIPEKIFVKPPPLPTTPAIVSPLPAPPVTDCPPEVATWRETPKTARSSTLQITNPQGGERYHQGNFACGFKANFTSPSLLTLVLTKRNTPDWRNYSYYCVDSPVGGPLAGAPEFGTHDNPMTRNVPVGIYYLLAIVRGDNGEILMRFTEKPFEIIAGSVPYRNARDRD